MIRLGIVGTADPRHRWFLAAALRRRAGVRVVGFSEANPVARTEAVDRHPFPAYVDHRALLAETSPSLLAVAQPDPGQVVIDALHSDADVLVLPPICSALDQLDTIAELAASRGRRVTAALTYRGHPAARTAAELTDRLGPIEVLSLSVGDDRSDSSLAEGLDLFHQFTGLLPTDLTPITAGHPARDNDPDDVTDTLGELIMLGDGPVEGPAFELRRHSEPAAETVQLVGENGVVEWHIRTGIMRSAFGDRTPITVSCGRPDQPEWVLNKLIRRRDPVVTTAHTLSITRTLLSGADR